MARDSSIDALRVAGLLLVVAGHAAVPYISGSGPELLWPVRHLRDSSIADVIFWLMRCAQPQMFFLIAGLISERAVAAAGPARFLAARLRRIGVPLVAGVVFVLPLVAAIWAWGWLESGRVTWSEVRAWRFGDPAVQRNALGPAHLWFLEDLLVISALFAAWRVWPRRKQRASVPGLHGSRLGLPVLMLASTGILIVRPAVLFELRNTFVPDVLRIAYGASFFAAGVWLSQHRETLRRWPPALVLLAAAVLTAAVVPRLLVSSPAGGLQNFALAAAGSATGWLSVIGGLKGFSRGAFSLPPSAQRLAEASYGIYVIHLPIVGLAHVLLSPFGVSATLAIVISAVFAMGLSWLLVSMTTRLAERWQELSARMRAIRLQTWTMAAIVLGIGLRVMQYLRNPDVSQDEAALLVNVIERGYARLLGPLTYNEAAPPLFLWVERWISLHLSDSTWAMRSLPFAASCAALVMMLPATRVIHSRMAPVAVFLMASSFKLIGHSVEAQPYALDVLLAAAALSLFEITRAWPSWPRVAVLSAMSPLLMWASYPGVFLAGGIVCALFLASRGEGRRQRAGFAVLILVVAASLALLVAFPVRAQRSGAILQTWQWAFPIGFDPITLVVWLVRSIVGIADYCFRPFGGLLLVPIAVGICSLVRRGERALVALLIAPLALAGLAGLAWQYPFSGSRAMLFALPALALLTAEGLGVILSPLPTRALLAQATALAVVVLPPIVMSAREVVSPSERPATAAAAQLVLGARQPNEIVAANHWQYRYYLRHLGSAFVSLEERPLPPGHERIWCIVQGENASERRALMAALAGGSYEIANTVDLRGVSVMELGARR